MPCPHQCRIHRSVGTGARGSNQYWIEWWTVVFGYQIRTGPYLTINYTKAVARQMGLTVIEEPEPLEDE